MEKLWGTKKDVREAYGVNWRKLYEWREKGWVRIAKTSATHVVFRLKDVDHVLMSLSEGRTPKRAV